MTTIKTLKIKKLSTEYEEALLIRRKVFVEEQQVPLNLEFDDKEMTSYHFLTYSADRPVAAGRMRVTGSCIKFERIATLREFRGQGAGKNLL
jgi:predicted GNAT family N-acyltransferase